MLTSRFLPLLIILSLITIPITSLSPQTQDNNYSMITIINNTSQRIFYEYRWGEGTNSYSNSIPPEGVYKHWWTFNYPNEDYAPWFYLSRQGESEWHKLGSFFSPDTSEENGRYYRFHEESPGVIEFQEKIYRN